MSGSLLCRLGWHQWRTEVNDSGERYKTCRRCKKFDNGPGVTPPMAGPWPPAY